MRVLALLFLAAAAWGQKADEFPMTVDGFRGQNTYIDSARLPPSSAQSAYNVLTEHGYAEKRPGSVLATTFGAKVGNLHEYVKAAGSRLLMGHTGDYVKQTDLGTTPAIVSTVTASGTVNFVSAFNKVVFVDGYFAKEYDGSSTSTVTGAPGCKLIEFDQNRLWCANIVAESQSMIRISSVGGTGYWTVPANVNTVADAPNYFYIQRDDGQPITCLKKTPWGMVAGKRRSMWVIKGYDNRNWYIINIDPAIGCVDDRSMQMVDGRLQWLGVDGVYSWAGAGPAKLESLEVDSIIKTARQSAAQTENWALDSQSDWLGGTLDFSGAGAKMSATISPGNIVPSTWGVVHASTTNFTSGSSTNIDFTSIPIKLSSAVCRDDFSDGDYTTGPTTWTLTAGAMAVSIGAKGLYSPTTGPPYESSVYTTQIDFTSGAWDFHFLVGSQASGSETPMITFRFQKDVAGSFYALRLSDIASGYTKYLDLVKYVSPTTTVLTRVILDLTAGTNMHFLVVKSTCGVITVYRDDVFMSSVTDTAITTSVEGEVLVWGFYTEETFNYFSDLYSYAYRSPGSITGPILDTGISTTVGGAFSSTSTAIAGETEIDFYVRESSMSNDTAWSSWMATSDTLRVPLTKTYWQHKSILSTFISTKTPSIQSIELSAATTGWYLSPVHFVGVDISSWGAFDVGQTLLGLSSATYQVRQATFTFLPTNTAIAWSGQTANSIITALPVSTPTYFQWRGLLLLDSATAYPTISVVRANWTSGLAGSPAASGVLNHRYLLCLAISSATNDTCLVQQQTRDWVVFGGQSQSAMTIYNNELFAGSPDSTGKVWRTMQDGVYNDDGTAINAHWTGPDYMFGDPVGQKAISEIWLDAQASTGTILSVGYSVDKSTTLITKNIDLGSSSNVINRRVPIDKGFALGKYFRLNFSNAQDKYFRVNGFTLFGQVKPRTE